MDVIYVSCWGVFSRYGVVVICCHVIPYGDLYAVDHQPIDWWFSRESMMRLFTCAYGGDEVDDSSSEQCIE